MKTRKQYLSGEITHSDYYAQFACDTLAPRLVRSIGPERLLASEDEHLNDIPLKEWDSLIGIVQRGSSVVILYRPEGVKYHALMDSNGSGGVSPADLICVAKSAARRWIAENTITQAEWDKIHADYKGGTGRVRRVLRLTESGTASVPIRVEN